jgi:hypothetical protein
MERKVILSVAALALACLVASPIIHEAVHMIVLGSYSGSYTMKFDIFPSVSACERVLSPLSLFQYTILLSSGILASFLAGFLLIRRGRKNMCHLSSMSGIGFFLNPALVMFYKNDFSILLSFYSLGALSLFAGIALTGFCIYEASFAVRILSIE